MKLYSILSLSLMPLWIILYCYDPFYRSEIDRQKTYSSNFPAYNLSFSMTIVRSKSSVVVHRSQHAIDTTLQSNMVYFEDQPDQVTTYEQFMKVSDGQDNLWFVPFFTATSAIPLGDEINQCLLFQCVYSKVPSPFVPQGVIQKRKEGLQCQVTSLNPGEPLCHVFSLVVPCDDPMEHIMENVYTGGVLLRAEKIEIIDPPGTKKAEGIKFYMHSDGSLMPYEDAIRLGLIRND